MSDGNTNYCQAVFPPPPLDDAAPCAVCGGLGLTHERVSTNWSPDPLTGRARLLLLPVFCPACGGCGRSGHDGCAWESHGYPSGALDELTDGPPPKPEEDDAFPDGRSARDRERRCPWCDDRGWRHIQAFRETSDGARIFARTPCGCTEPLIEPVPAEDVE
ncbi:hypothetical protein [Actinomadura gamaensis]|uniref:Uncharacterized protein n=1 Tax=Actinomadura gamaensis TaxID=1763541 RepID=A0ABV9U0M4_9ACTN